MRSVLPSQTTRAGDLEELGREMRLAAAIKLFELGKLSSGAAAKLAGIPRVLFLTKLADYNVDTFNLTEEELRAEMSIPLPHAYACDLRFSGQLPP